MVCVRQVEIRGQWDSAARLVLQDIACSVETGEELSRQPHRQPKRLHGIDADHRAHL